MPEISEDFATGSVISYFEREGKMVVQQYLNSHRENKVGFPSYSDMLKATQLSGGTTREGIRFDSSKIKRSVVTKYLKDKEGMSNV